MKIETIQIPADNEAGYVIVNKEDAGTEAVAKWATAKAVASKSVDDSGGAADDDADAAPDKAKLLKMRKGELVAMAEEAGIEIVPDEETIPTLVDKILEARDQE